MEKKIRALMAEKRELQAMYKRAVQRSHEIRTRVVAPENEAVRKEILARYRGEKYGLNQQINDIGDEIRRLQHEGND